MGRARRGKLRQADAKLCEETSDYSGKGLLMDFAEAPQAADREIDDFMTVPRSGPG
jgi:hypothetical protein